MLLLNRVSYLFIIQFPTSFEVSDDLFWLPTLETCFLSTTAILYRVISTFWLFLITLSRPDAKHPLTAEVVRIQSTCYHNPTAALLFYEASSVVICRNSEENGVVLVPSVDKIRPVQPVFPYFHFLQVVTSGHAEAERCSVEANGGW